MDFNFVKYEKRNKRSEHRITITKHNSIGFPTGFFEDNKIGQYKTVGLYYDAANKAIALKFATDDTDKSLFKILVNNKGYGGGVVAKSFFQDNNLDVNACHGRYNWEKMNLPELGEVFVIKLNK